MFIQKIHNTQHGEQASKSDSFQLPLFKRHSVTLLGYLSYSAGLEGTKVIYSDRTARLYSCWSKDHSFSTYLCSRHCMIQESHRMAIRDSMIKIRVVTCPEVTTSTLQLFQIKCEQASTLEIDAFAHAQSLEWSYSFTLTLEVSYMTGCRQGFCSFNFVFVQIGPKCLSCCYY